MKVVACFLLAAFVAVSQQQAFQGVPEYEWKLYRGTTPWNALNVNPGDCKEPLYIGLAWFKEGLMPGSLKANDTEVVATAGLKKILKSSFNTMILVTDHPHMYDWIPTTTETFEQTKQLCELVVAGEQNEHTLYVGRQVRDGKILVGKVYAYPTRELALPLENIDDLNKTDTQALKFWLSIVKPCPL